MGYTHLTTVERYQLFSLTKAGHGIAFIAQQLGRHRSTLHRELKRNLVFDPRFAGYSPSRADGLARSRRIVRSHTKRITHETWAAVEDCLHARYSPQQIRAELSTAGTAPVSHEAIYLRIWKDKRMGGDLWTYLRGKLRRGRRYRSNRQRGQIIGRISMDCRPVIANERRRRGDFEIDTVFGKGHKAALVTIVDRRSRYLMVEKVPTKHADVVAESLIRALRRTGRPVHSLTSDNGKEFARHEYVSKALNAKFFFARPYASWERGTNENTNGLLRQYFPKDRDFSTITQEEIDFAVWELNHRPREVIGFQKPHAVFFA